MKVSSDWPSLVGVSRVGFVVVKGDPTDHLRTRGSSCFIIDNLININKLPV